MWAGQAVSLVGSALVQFALVWWLTIETASATTLAAATVAGMLPVILLGPFAGVLIDRWSRRWTMITSDALTALFTTLLAGLFWLGIVQVWHVFVILFLRSLGDVFHNPAMRASTSLMVPRDQLTRVSGMNSALQGVIRFVAPPMGAMLLAALHIKGILVIDIVTAALAITSLLLVRVPQPTRATAAEGKPSVIHDMVKGFQYLWNETGLMLLFTTATIGMLFFVSPLTFVPLLVTKHFGGDALQLGWMQSAYGWGYLVGGTVLGVWGGFRNRMYTSIFGTFGLAFGLLIAGLAPSRAFGVALVAWFLFGLALPIAAGPIQAIYQSVVPVELQGRFFTLNRSVVNLATPLGLAIGGLVADSIGVRTLFLIGGAVALVLAFVRASTPAILALDDADAPVSA